MYVWFSLRTTAPVLWLSAGFLSPSLCLFVPVRPFSDVFLVNVLARLVTTSPPKHDMSHYEEKIPAREAQLQEDGPGDSRFVGVSHGERCRC